MGGTFFLRSSDGSRELWACTCGTPPERRVIHRDFFLVRDFVVVADWASASREEGSGGLEPRSAPLTTRGLSRHTWGSPHRPSHRHAPPPRRPACVAVRLLLKGAMESFGRSGGGFGGSDEGMPSFSGGSLSAGVSRRCLSYGISEHQSTSGRPLTTANDGGVLSPQSVAASWARLHGGSGIQALAAAAGHSSTPSGSSLTPWGPPPRWPLSAACSASEPSSSGLRPPTFLQHMVAGAVAGTTEHLAMFPVRTPRDAALPTLRPHFRVLCPVISRSSCLRVSRPSFPRASQCRFPRCCWRRAPLIKGHVDPL